MQLNSFSTAIPGRLPRAVVDATSWWRLTTPNPFNYTQVATPDKEIGE